MKLITKHKERLYRQQILLEILYYCTIRFLFAFFIVFLFVSNRGEVVISMGGIVDNDQVREYVN